VDTPASWLLPARAAAILKVDPGTVARWANAGRVSRVQRTLGGHRRYEESEIRALADALTEAAA